MSSPAVDFSDLGAKPVAGSAPAKVTFDDLGAKPVSSVNTMAPPSQVAPGGGLQGAVAKGLDALPEIGAGAVKSAAQPVATVAGAINKIPKVGETLAPKAGVQALEQGTKIETGPQAVGAGIEQIAEFALGEKALTTGLTAAGKLKQLSSMVTFLERYPRIAKIIGTAMRQGGLATGQGVAHGEDLGTAATQGAIVGAAGGGLEAAHVITGGALAKEQARVAAGKQVETAGAAAEKAGAEHAAAKEGLAESKDAAGAAKAGVKTAEVEGKAAGAAAETARMGQAQEQARAAFKPSFGEMAESLRDQARPTYEKINAATNGDFNKLMAERNAARRAKDFTKYQELNDKMDQMFAERTGAVSGDQMAAARENWRNSKVLDDIHDAVESSFTLPEDVAGRTGQARDLKGQALRPKLNRLMMNQRAEVERVIGKDGIDNLYRMAELTTPQKAKLTQEAAEKISQALAEQERTMQAVEANKTKLKAAAEKAGQSQETLATAKKNKEAMGSDKLPHVIGLGALALAGHAGAGAGIGAGVALATGHSPTKGAWIGLAAGAGAKAVIHAAAVNPRVGQLLSYAIEKGVNPKIYAPLIAAEIRGQEEPLAVSH